MQPSKNPRPCATCGGKKTVTVVVKGKAEPRTCPACHGSGYAGIVTK